MNKENALILKTAFTIANKTKAEALLVHADALDDLIFEERVAKKFDLVLLSKKKRLEAGEDETHSLAAAAKATISLPRIHLTRISLIKIATTLALSQEIVKPGARLVFAVGQMDSGPLDLIQSVDTSKESEIIAGRGVTKLPEVVQPELFQAVLNLSIELADKGREGKPVGTIFVVGDHEKVMQLSKQMIMNPFKGYEEEERNILFSSLKETIREFSAMDGAFVIADDGTVLASGRYLGAAIDESALPRGLGSRHIAAAGITSLTKAIAFVISESSGDVRIFKDGKIIMHIEKAESKR
jgi:DNA integrity scanning protein DisA with diadenylate cyclase activity